MDKTELLEKTDKEIISILKTNDIDKVLENFKIEDLKQLIDKMGGNRKGNISKRETFIKNIKKFIDNSNVETNGYYLKYEFNKNDLLKLLDKKIKSFEKEDEDDYIEESDKEVQQRKLDKPKKKKKSEKKEPEKELLKKILVKEQPENKELRAEEIAENAYKVGRNPLDTAGMETDDEIWVDENPDYADYIEKYYQELKNRKSNEQNSDEEQSSSSSSDSDEEQTSSSSSEEDDSESEEEFEPENSELKNMLYLERYENNNIVYHTPWDDSIIKMSGKGTLIKTSTIFSPLTENGNNIPLGSKIYVTNDNSPLYNSVNKSNCIIASLFSYNTVHFYGCVMSGMVIRKNDYVKKEKNICNEKLCITKNPEHPTLRIGKYGIDYNSTREGETFHFFVGKHWTDKDTKKEYMFDVHPSEDLYQCYLPSKTLSAKTEFTQYKKSKIKLVKKGRYYEKYKN